MSRRAVRDELRPAETDLLSENRWSISAIVLWELAELIQLGRLDMHPDDREVVQVLSRTRRWPIGLAAARASTRLDFTSNPADEIIAAASVVHNIPLLTQDNTVRQSQIVPLAL